jgi:antiviral helicase SKI2
MENVDLKQFEGLQDEDYYHDLYVQRSADEDNRRRTTQQMQKLVLETETEDLGDSSASESSDSAAVMPLPSKATQLSAELAEILLDESKLSTDEWLARARKMGAASRTKKSDWAVLDRMENISLDFRELVPDMAIEYPFELDDFQKEAIYHLEESESVFIAAHTSAGKTVVAEYAIALAFKHMTRAVYTSPIKALSNQKYRDFKDVFQDVGIITGDVQVKPDATCLIVTTEILRSMLYKGADLVRDVEWVIFDEVHYINDMERGVVWEEVIIMLPDHVNMIFLSATVPNVFEFADWVGRVKKKKVFVISTDKRPVPLEHYIYANKEVYKIVDNKKQFLSQGYRAAQQSFKDKEAKRAAKAKKGGAPPPAKRNAPGAAQSKGEWTKIISSLKSKNLLPAVGFAFSKAKCMEIATGLSLDLTTAVEKSEIHVFIDQAIKRLKGADRYLPQVQTMRDLLKRGIGVHHGGLLPIIKEMVEILFARSLVKILFATETFAMGVNMPTKTVVFHSTRKHDGQNWRDLLPSEYIQMSGRAGRRGLDTVGTVIIIAWDEVHESGALQTMILGKPTKLESQFRLTYNMMLNLLKMGGNFKVEDMIKRSFSEASNQKILMRQRDRLKKAEAQVMELEDIVCHIQPASSDMEDGIKAKAPMYEYFGAIKEAEGLDRSIQKCACFGKRPSVLLFCSDSCSLDILTSSYAKEYVATGRVVILNSAQYKNTIGCVIRVGAADSRAAILDEKASKVLRVFILTGKPSRLVRELYSVITVDWNDIASLCKSKFKVDAFEILDKPMEASIKKLIEQIEQLRAESLPSLPPALDPVKDLKIKDMDLMEMYNRRKRLQDVLVASPCHTCSHKAAQMEKMEAQQKLRDQVHAMKHLLSDQSLLMMPEFEMRLNVLQRLNYVDADRIVQLKGRVAREVTTCEELIATELIFENILTPLTPEEIVSLLSCLIFQEKSENEPEIPERLKQAYLSLNNLSISLANIQVEYGLKLSPLDWVKDKVKPKLMEVVYEWARNMSFNEITKLTDVPEGSIVRTIVRLDETCRDFKNAARIIGDTDLARKMEEASHLIKRDIVFASSLYITGK